MRHRSGFTRIALATAVACSALAALAAPAGAAPASVSVFPYDDQDPNGHGPIGVIQVRAQAGDDTPHHIWAEPRGTGTHRIRDLAGIVIAPEAPGDEQAQKCAQVDPTTVDCGLPEGETYGKLDVRAGRGSDRILLQRLDSAVLWADVFGQGGADRILGSDEDDNLYGGRGRDFLMGNLGQDVISGGKDVDRIRSRDGLRDQISCGPGDNRREKAIRDPFDRQIVIVAGGSFIVDKQPISC